MGYSVLDSKGKWMYDVNIHGLKKFKGSFRDDGVAKVPFLIKRLKELGWKEEAKRVEKGVPPT
jgi:hypothetical protein